MNAPRTASDVDSVETIRRVSLDMDAVVRELANGDGYARTIVMDEQDRIMPDELLEFLRKQQLNIMVKNTVSGLCVFICMYPLGGAVVMPTMNEYMNMPDLF